MKLLQKIGLGLFLFALLTFSALLFSGSYLLDESVYRSKVASSHQELLDPYMTSMLGEEYPSSFKFISAYQQRMDALNDSLKGVQAWDKVIYDDYSFSLTKSASVNPISTNKALFLVITVLLGVLGSLLYVGVGTRNFTGIYFKSYSNRGWIGIIIGFYLIAFYVLLYNFPAYIVNWVILIDPISYALNGSEASQWFLYGFLYTLAIIVMGVRMLLKYKHSPYHNLRTASIMFFQLAFAFLIPQILQRLNLPATDLKNMWPLDYTFFFEYRLNELVGSGYFGLWLLVWGIILFSIIVPVMTYLYGKRWYCSWVCGCGGLAETLGDPFRQLSDKSVKAWQVERVLIHAVLVFAVFMTTAVLYTYFSGDTYFIGLNTYKIREWYGFGIGMAFSGVIGTGFYPLMGNRVWCRFGCPLAAYMGIIQRFKSRFRITTNGGQCISCGNCSTYCEMGIDVRAYAQKGQNIVRASCVGCGVCSSVCPRGVLNLEVLKNDDQSRYE